MTFYVATSYRLTPLHNARCALMSNWLGRIMSDSYWLKPNSHPNAKRNGFVSGKKRGKKNKMEVGESSWIFLALCLLSGFPFNLFGEERNPRSDATIFPQPLRVPERAPPPQWIWSLGYPLFPSFQAARRWHLVPLLRPGKWGASGLLTEVIAPQRDPLLQLQLIAALFHKLLLSSSSLAAAAS